MPATTDAARRFAAWRLSRFGHLADDALSDKKRKAFEGAHGVILEIGPGCGQNSRYFDSTSRLLGIERNEYLRSKIADRYAVLPYRNDEAIALPDASVDSVICSLVLCSVCRLDFVLGEIFRVIKPDGTFRFIEHVPAPTGSFGFLAQRLMRPVCQKISDGCTPDRDIESSIRKTPFIVQSLDHFSVDIHDPLIRNFIAGICMKEPRKSTHAKLVTQ